MRLNGRWPGSGLMLIGLVLVTAWTSAAIAKAPSNASKAIDGFIAHLNELDAIDQETIDSVTATVRAMGEDEYDREIAITEGLSQLYPEYAEALAAMSGEDLDVAVKKLKPFCKSEDRYLLADATFFLARAYVYSERYEEALPLLSDFVDNLENLSVQTGTALYLKGMSEASLIMRPEAKETLERYLQEYPESSERMKVSAWRQLQTLHAIEEGSIGDAFQRMELSRRRLELQETGDPTQTEQEKIVGILATLIKKAEEQECQGGNCNGNQPSPGEGQGDKKGAGKGGQEGGGSNVPDGTVVRRTFGTGPLSPWSRLRDRSRDPAFTALKEKYPARYQKMIEQYYKSFQDGDQQ